MTLVSIKPLKTKAPFVTAIIAAHNEEIHLANCIESLLNQTYKKMEIFIIENGESNDKTLNIAQSYQKKYPSRVKAFTIKGKQKGPGPAWNYGIIHAKGELVMICGADLRYGADYVSKGIVPIVNGKSVGIVHLEELCNNTSNLWARAFFYKRSSVYRNNNSRVFSIIKKSYVKARPFNSELGYSDDQTIYLSEGTEFQCIDLKVNHTNPASFADTWSHSLWVGRSIHKSWQLIAIIPIFPLYALYKTITHLKIDFYIPFIFFLPYYYSIRYWAYTLVAIKEIFRKV